jgi:hypothetical protein
MPSLPQEPAKAAPYLRRMAAHHEAAGAWAEAERCLVRAGAALEAAEMHAAGGRWEAAQKVGWPAGCPGAASASALLPNCITSGSCPGPRQP